MTQVRKQNLWQRVLGKKKTERRSTARRMFLEPLEVRRTMTADAGGNSLSAATDLGTINVSQQVADFVGRADTNDYYRFRLNGRSDLRLDLNGLSADADLQLLGSNGSTLASSTRGGNSSELINRTLDAGDYVVRVFRYSGDTNYQLTLTVTVLINQPAAATYNSFYVFGSRATLPNDQWYAFPLRNGLGVEFMSEQLVVHLADGSLGDDDLTQNGVVMGVGGPAVNSSPQPWKNLAAPTDVDGDGFIAPIDALIVINRINANGPGPLAVPLVAPNLAPDYVDVNGDNFLAPVDALIVINDLNANGAHPAGSSGAAQSGGEGERDEVIPEQMVNHLELGAGTSNLAPTAVGKLAPRFEFTLPPVLAMKSVGLTEDSFFVGLENINRESNPLESLLGSRLRFSRTVQSRRSGS